MNIPKEAIEKAIEGGYKGKFKGTNPKGIYQPEGKVLMPDKWTSIVYYQIGHSRLGLPSLSEIALDPTFWQALGKSLGWPNDYWNYEYRLSADETRRQGHVRYAEGMALYFHELILTNGDTDAYWKEILPAK